MSELNRVLQLLQFQPSVFHRLQLAAPFGFSTSSQHGANLHWVEQGTCWLHIVATDQRIQLIQGDVVVIFKNDDYDIRDAFQNEIAPLTEIVKARDANGVVRHTGTDPIALVLNCGEFRVAHPVFDWLFDTLPPLIHIHGTEGQAVDWFAAVLKLVNIEAVHDYPGRDVVVSRLMDVLFIMCVRYWMVHQATQKLNWFTALDHPQLGKVLSSIHQQPEVQWTLETLSLKANVSRSWLASQFKLTIGESPMKYLTRWRLQLAAMWLILHRDWSIEDIASRIGYTDPFAFSKAFKRWFGVSPSEYRVKQ